MSGFVKLIDARLACCIVLFAAFSGFAAAEIVQGDGMPSALKGISQAGGVCRPDDKSFASGLPEKEALVKADYGCAITASEVRNQMSAPEVLLVDLRPAGEYQTLRIDNALNADLTSLLSKPYWRDKRIILVGRGKFDHDHYISCAKLKRSGYRHVRVMQGGMLSWLAHDFELVGRTVSPQQMARLTASELWQEMQADSTLIVLDRARASFQSEIPQALVLTQPTTEALKKLVDARRKNSGAKRLSSVILLADADTGDSLFKDLQSAALPAALLLYTESREDYRRQLKIQDAVWSAQARGPKRPRCGL